MRSVNEHIARRITIFPPCKRSRRDAAQPAAALWFKSRVIFKNRMDNLFSKLDSRQDGREGAMAEFAGIDFYRMDELLSEEEKMVRDTVRSFVSEKVVPVIDKHFEHATFPMELIPEMASLGVFGANLPEDYGCA